MARGVEKLHPELQVIARQFIDRCRADGLPVLITETLRSESEQTALYAKGRTIAGNIVTNCKYPQSPHCWGVAFDFCRNVSGRAYDDSDGFFEKCGAIGKQLGLFWGGDFKSFKDKPHLELKKYLPNNSVKTLQRQYGTPADFIDSWIKTSNRASPQVRPTDVQTEEHDTMTQEQFYIMFERAMDIYNAKLAGKPVSKWADNAWKKAEAAGVFDGTKPGMEMTREQMAVLMEKAGMLK